MQLCRDAPHPPQSEYLECLDSGNSEVEDVERWIWKSWKDQKRDTPRDHPLSDTSKYLIRVNTHRTRKVATQPLLLIEWISGSGALVNIRRFLRECIGSHIFDDSDLDDSSCWPADTSYPCGGNPMVMLCAAAATTQTETARMDNNFIFSREE